MSRAYYDRAVIWLLVAAMFSLWHHEGFGEFVVRAVAAGARDEDPGIAS